MLDNSGHQIINVFLVDDEEVIWLFKFPLHLRDQDCEVDVDSLSQVDVFDVFCDQVAALIVGDQFPQHVEEFLGIGVAYIAAEASQ